MLNLYRHLSPRELDAGWPVKCRIDPWTFGNLVGWDTAEIL